MNLQQNQQPIPYPEQKSKETAKEFGNLQLFGQNQKAQPQQQFQKGLPGQQGMNFPFSNTAPQAPQKFQNLSHNQPNQLQNPSTNQQNQLFNQGQLQNQPPNPLQNQLSNQGQFQNQFPNQIQPQNRPFNQLNQPQLQNPIINQFQAQNQPFNQPTQPQVQNQLPNQFQIQDQVNKWNVVAPIIKVPNQTQNLPYEPKEVKTEENKKELVNAFNQYISKGNSYHAIECLKQIIDSDIRVKQMDS